MNSLIYSHGRIGAGLAFVILIFVVFSIFAVLFVTNQVQPIPMVTLIFMYAVCFAAIDIIWKKNGWF